MWLRYDMKNTLNSKELNHKFFYIQQRIKYWKSYHYHFSLFCLFWTFEGPNYVLDTQTSHQPVKHCLISADSKCYNYNFLSVVFTSSRTTIKELIIDFVKIRLKTVIFLVKKSLNVRDKLHAYVLVSIRLILWPFDC